MTERLTLNRLGPIESFTLAPRPLTVLIGEQATGKSLVAQTLYFFRGLKRDLGGLYRPDLTEAENWQTGALRILLDRLRGVPFDCFSNEKATIHYRKNDTGWKIDISKDDRKISPNRTLHKDMSRWVSEWEKDKSLLGESGDPDQIFIPTERSVFTRLWHQAQTVLFAEHQPWPLRTFAEYLGKAYSAYRSAYLETNDTHRFLLACQRRALGGEAYVPERGHQLWKWKVTGETPRVIPIEAVASGQMEAWPFFVIAATFGTAPGSRDFYFEEPETHLHPKAQVEIMRAIAFLVNRGHRFVITTHSPFPLYVLNNMIQRFLSLDGKPLEGDIALNPEKVAAYRLGPVPESILDRDDTRLIDLEDLEKVADDLGGEFDMLLETGGDRSGAA